MMLKAIILTFIFTVLYPEEQPCRISKNNISEILQFGVDKDLFSSNCVRFSDTVSFLVDKNDCNFKEGDVFKLKNGKVAVYKQNQPKNSSTVIKQLIFEKGNYLLYFDSFCGGYETNGSMKITCSGDTLEVVDFDYVKSVE